MKSTDDLKLTIFTETEIEQLSNGSYASNDSLVRFFEELSNHFKKISLVVPCTTGKDSVHSQSNFSYLIERNNIDIVKLPSYQTTQKFLTRPVKYLLPIWRKVRLSLKEAEIVIVRSPSAFEPIIYLLINLYRKKNIFLYIAGEQNSRIDLKFSGPKKFMARAAAGFYEALRKYMIRHYPAFVLGQKLYDYYQDIAHDCIKFELSLIKENEIALEQDCSITEPARLLYAGGLRREKGLLQLLDAFALIAKKKPVVLDIVGEGPLKPSLEKKISESISSEKINLLGHIPFGKHLFEIYKRADVFVLPSHSEGFPKVIFEAMAFGVPIVATKVGGIPYLLEHRKNALLVERGNAEALYLALDEVINNKALRKSIQYNNYSLIAKHTLEKKTKFIADIIKGGRES